MTYERPQINAKLIPSPDYPIMKDVPEVYVPFYWYDETFNLDKTSKALIQLAY